MPSTDERTVHRVRDAMRTAPSLREVPMFGGVSFMVDDKLVVNVRRDGRLLVRVDPDSSPTLVADHGGRRAQMGPGRDMGPGWIEVDCDLVADDDRLRFWIDTAMTYTAQLPPARTKG